MRKNSIKNTRINSEVQRELANMIRGEIKDPRIAPMTCVTDVYVAPDLKTCKVYISVLGGEDKRRETLEGLRSAEGYMRKKLASTLNLRNTPQLTFVADTSTEYGMAMSAKIDEVMAPIHEKEALEAENAADDEANNDNE